MATIAYGAVASASAQPCQIDLLTDVKTVHVDVPSALHPSFWYEGRIGDLNYRHFPNGVGVLTGRDRLAPWRITFDCKGDDGSCKTDEVGSVPSQAKQVLRHLKTCTVQQTAPQNPLGVNGAIAEIEPVLGVEMEEPTPEPNQRCTAPAVDESAPVRSLQALLVAAGAKIAVDGLFGPKTRSALNATLKTDADGFSVSEAIAQVEDVLCNQSMAQTAPQDAANS